jgi:hypothetical protein
LRTRTWTAGGSSSYRNRSSAVVALSTATTTATTATIAAIVVVVVVVVSCVAASQSVKQKAGGQGRCFLVGQDVPHSVAGQDQELSRRIRHGLDRQERLDGQAGVEVQISQGPRNGQRPKTQPVAEEFVDSVAASAVDVLHHKPIGLADSFDFGRQTRLVVQSQSLGHSGRGQSRRKTPTGRGLEQQEGGQGGRCRQ